MANKRLTTGFGRSFADVPAIANKPIDQYFKDAAWTILSKDDKSSTFGYTCTNRFKGDDDTVLESLSSEYPEALDPMWDDARQVTIDWTMRCTSVSEIVVCLPL